MTPDDLSPDHDERIEDFLTRHGGASTQPARQGALEGGARGWSEVYAADGYALRCEWTQTGGRETMSYTEVPP